MDFPGWPTFLYALHTADGSFAYACTTVWWNWRVMAIHNGGAAGPAYRRDVIVATTRPARYGSDMTAFIKTMDTDSTGIYLHYQRYGFIEYQLDCCGERPTPNDVPGLLEWDIARRRYDWRTGWDCELGDRKISDARRLQSSGLSSRGI